MLQIQVTDNKILLTSASDFVSGTVNSQQVEFIFNAAWDSLTKIASFKAGTVSIDVELTIDDDDKYIATIPHEVLAVKDKILTVGLIGLSGSDVVLPTPYLTLKSIVQGTEVSGITPSDPTPTIYTEILDDIADLQEQTANMQGQITENFEAIGFAELDIGALEEETASLQTQINNLPAIPTNVSAFTNDAGYLTEHQSLEDYAKKTVLLPLATKTEVSDVDSKIDDLSIYVGYPSEGVYGVEADFANKTFTRISGAVGKTAGADFDGINAFGGRRRCNLADDGTVNAYYGDAGYIEDGSNGQVMVEQPKFYYKVVPLVLDKPEFQEINTITVTAGATSSGDLTITLNGISFTVAVLSSDSTTTAVATKIRNATYTGWTTSGTGANVIFTCNTVGAKATATFSAASTGVTATVAKTQSGCIGKGYRLRKARYYISDTMKSGFKVHPAFIKNGVEKNFIYLSAYEGSLFDVSTSTYILDDAQVANFTVTTGDKLSSISNAKPISGYPQALNRRNCGIIAENRGNGWSQQYCATVSCTQILFMIEYASFNSQTAIGSGITNETSSKVTGATSSLGNSSGMAEGLNGKVSISYRGEENIWGNIWKFIDGMNVYCDIANNIHDLYVADNSFAESKNDENYKNAGITLATKDGYISAMAYSESYDWLFVPSETLGDSALPVGDFYNQSTPTNGYKIVQLGGDWSISLSGGIYMYTTSYITARSSSYGSGRLVYIPQ